MSIPAPWMENDQPELDGQCNVPIKMADTLYGRFLVQQMRDAERACQKMSAEAKVDFARKMVEIDKVGAEDGQSPPPSLTPV